MVEPSWAEYIQGKDPVLELVNKMIQRARP